MGSLQTVQFEHHPVADVQTARHTADTIQQFLDFTGYMYRDRIFRIHQRVVYHILHRTTDALQCFVDITFPEDFHFGACLMGFVGRVKAV